MAQTETTNQYDDLLFIIKQLEKQFNYSTTSTLTQFSSLQNQITELATKQGETSLQLLGHKAKIEKIDDFTSFISKSNDVHTTHEIRINTAIKDISNAKYKYDKVILENLNVPGFIGDYCKYKNLREYLDFNIKEMSMLNYNKQKNELDLKTYKDKLEGLMKEFQRQIGLFSNQQKAYSEVVKKEAFEYIDQCRNDFYSKYDEILLENGRYSFELRDKANKLQAEWQKVLQIKNEVDMKIDKTLEDMKTESSKTLDLFKCNNKEFSRIKSKFAEMVEFIKDVRFRKNLDEFNVIKKREISNLTDKLQFNNQRRKKDIAEAKPLDLKYDVFTGQEIQSGDEAEDFDEREQEKEVRQEPGNDDLIMSYGVKSKKSSKSLSPAKRTTIRTFPKPIKEYNERNNGITNMSNSYSNINNNIGKNSSIKHVFPNVDNSFKENDQNSNNNNYDSAQLMKNDLVSESRNYRILQRQVSSKLISDYSPKHSKQPLNNEWKISSNRFNPSVNAMSCTASLLNNKMLLNTVDISSYNNLKNGNPPVLRSSKPSMTRIPSITKSPAEGKLITLHFKEHKSATCIHGYENKNQVSLALKPSNSDKKKKVGFSTAKDYDKVIDKVFLATTSQIIFNPKTKSNLINQITKEKRNQIKNELIEESKKRKLKYEAINKVLTNRPVSKHESKERDYSSKSLDLNM